MIESNHDSTTESTAMTTRQYYPSVTIEIYPDEIENDFAYNNVKFNDTVTPPISLRSQTLLDCKTLFKNAITELWQATLDIPMNAEVRNAPELHGFDPYKEIPFTLNFEDFSEIEDFANDFSAEKKAGWEIKIAYIALGLRTHGEAYVCAIVNNLMPNNSVKPEYMPGLREFPDDDAFKNWVVNEAIKNYGAEKFPREFINIDLMADELVYNKCKYDYYEMGSTSRYFVVIGK